jgi:hypothetical protein
VIGFVTRWKEGSVRDSGSFLGVGGIGMGREGDTTHRVMFHCMSHLRTSQNFYLCSVSYFGGLIRTFQGWRGLWVTELPILHKQSLWWWFHCIRLQVCVGSVCVGDTSLMCRGRDVHDWVRQLDSSPSTRHWSVEVYVSHGPGSSGRNGSVRVYRSVIRTLFS